MTTSFVSRIGEHHGLGAFAVCLGLLVAGSFALDRRAAADGNPGEARLQSRLARIEAHEDAQHVEGAIAQARRALDTMRASDDAAVRGRASRIAEAATMWAERELDRRDVQRELLETQRRLTATRERAAAQRRVLEALMKERAALAREEQQ